MPNRSHACAALILCTSIAFAQEATPPFGAGNQGGGSSLLTPSPGMEPSTGVTPLQPGAPETPKPTAPSTAGPESSFNLPGGAGYAPLNFTPGQGHFDRKPLTFNTTVQQGYDDNINSSSGKGGAAPIKGSMMTSATEGVDMLLAQSRLGLSLGAYVGGQYYWENTSTKLTPSGSVNLLFAYKITPRMQFSTIINSLYTTQPTLSVVNGLNQSNNKGYLTTNTKSDITYAWTPRFSTDTMYSTNSTWYQDSTLKGSNFLNQTVGQSFRYAFTPLLTGVLDARYANLQYQTLPGGIPSTNDSDTYYALVGADFTLSRLLTASARVGDTIRDYKTAGIASSSSPYGEGSLNYTFSRTAALSWDARYGFEDGGSGSQAAKSLRTGVSWTQILSPRLRGSLGINYTHVTASSAIIGLPESPSQDYASATLGLQYAYTQSLSFFGNVSHMQNFSSNDLIKYSKQVFWLGATYSY